MTESSATPPSGHRGRGEQPGGNRGRGGFRPSRGGGRDRVGGHGGVTGSSAQRRPPSRPHTSRPPEVDAARQAALELLEAVRERGAYANLALPQILRDHGLSGRDAALATELAYGSCRALGQLDAIVAACGDKPLDAVDGEVLDALRLGAYQLLHTRIPSHAAVSVTVDLIRAGPRPQAAGYVNAVLRRVSERDLDAWVERLAPAETTDPLARLALATAHPRWIVSALADALRSSPRAVPPTDAPPAAQRSTEEPSADQAPADLAELTQALEANYAPDAVHLVARPGMIDRDELVEAAGGEPGRFSRYAVYLRGGDPGRLVAVASGAAGVQDEGSQLVALALADAEIDGSDSRWLDLAAGPGGKAALLGALAAQRGAHLDAVELARHRADLVRKTTKSLPVTVHLADGREPGLEPGSFDRVLLDAPCTGLGALRRRPESRWRRTDADVAPLVELQRELLASAARLVRPGGIVAYATCSPLLAETAGVVARRPEELELIDAREYFPGVPDLGIGPTVQLWPHRQGTDGMFCALMRRTS
ncbi:MAG: transcription antitermination factor NusB [Nakamurella sp.]